LALKVTVAMPGLRDVVDRVRVKASAAMTDVEVRAHIRDAFLQELALQNCGIRVRTAAKEEVFSDPFEKHGDIIITVDDTLARQETQDEGVVLLEGRAPSLSHKRLAGVLAWWVPGTRDVLNHLEIVPPEE